MAYRVLFWKPNADVDVWLPAHQPLGEGIRNTVLGGQTSDQLSLIAAPEFMERLRESFVGSRFEDNRKLYWSDELENGFVARYGDQFVEVCAFDLQDDDIDRIFDVASEFGCDHYDWGN
jgi:hypothetical protein